MDNTKISSAGKHAYLILCHNNFEQLAMLLELLDDERNDIYIHVDKKTRNVPFDMLRSAVKRSRLGFAKRIKVVWGGYSQIKAETSLLACVAGKGYAYCHFVSGIDLPLKSQDYIHSFFDRMDGKECVSFEKIDGVLERVKYYYPVQNIVGRKQGMLANILRRLQGLCLRLQQKLGVNRIKGREQMFHEGSNWVSISGKLADYIVSCRAQIKKDFRQSSCADELFIQTMLMNSPFKDNVHTESLRYIDWEHGNPYTFRNEDFDALIASDKLFARKFDSSVDREIVQRIYEHIKEQDRS